MCPAAQSDLIEDLVGAPPRQPTGAGEQPQRHAAGEVAEERRCLHDRPDTRYHVRQPSGNGLIKDLNPAGVGSYQSKKDL